MRQILLLAGALLFTCAPVWAQAGMGGQDEPAPGKEAPKKEEPRKDDAKKDTAKEAGKADPLKAYRAKGNTWTHKTTTKFGSYEDTSFTRYEVIEVTDTKATVKQTNLDKEEKEISNNSFEVSLKPEGDADTPKNTPKDDAKTSEEKIKVGAGEFTCVKRETESLGTKTTTWTCKSCHLVVKMLVASESGTTTTELIKAEIK